MIGTVHTFTTIHAGTEDPEAQPYAVLIVDLAGTRRAARAEGNLSWLRIGVATQLDVRSDGILLAEPTVR